MDFKKLVIVNPSTIKKLLMEWGPKNDKAGVGGGGGNGTANLGGTKILKKHFCGTESQKG